MAKQQQKPEGTGPKAKSGRKKVKRQVTTGRVYVQSSYNNTIVTITDPTGAVIAWASAGNVGFKGSRKNTPYAAQLAAEAAIKRALEYGLQAVDVYYKGPGAGKDAAVRFIQASKLKVGLVKDRTSAPHNGCRAPKRRRV